MVTRRAFLIASATAAATTCGGSAIAWSAEAKLPSAGALYGRTGENGMARGTPAMPSQGEVVLGDGTSLEAAHISGPIRPDRGVLLSPDPRGGWCVLYAEF